MICQERFNWQRNIFFQPSTRMRGLMYILVVQERKVKVFSCRFVFFRVVTKKCTKSLKSSLTRVNLGTVCDLSIRGRSGASQKTYGKAENIIYYCVSHLLSLKNSFTLYAGTTATNLSFLGDIACRKKEA